MVWWIASWAEDEQYKGRTASSGEVFLCLESVRMGDLNQFQLGLLLLWWLVLFIEALVVSPNIEREGSQQRSNSKGDN